MRRNETKLCMKCISECIALMSVNLLLVLKTRKLTKWFFFFFFKEYSMSADYGPGTVLGSY